MKIADETYYPKEGGWRFGLEWFAGRWRYYHIECVAGSDRDEARAEATRRTLEAYADYL